MPFSNKNLLTANQAWLHALGDVADFGVPVGPRGMGTQEILNYPSAFDMNSPICYHQDRKLSYKFMAAEAYWITSGSMFTEDIVPYNSHIAKFSDDDYIFNGAYGPKFINQLQFVVNQLRKDCDTRQAVMTIWIQNPIDTKDYACTLSLQFMIRDGRLNTIVNMRSNDLWLGRPYDMFNFTIMSLRVLTYLNEGYDCTYGELTRLGTLYLNAGSTHLYDQNVEEGKRISDLLPNKRVYRVPDRALCDWKFVVNSLLACRDMDEEAIQENNLWRIRP